MICKLTASIVFNDVICNDHLLVMSDEDLIEQCILGRDFLFRPNVID